MKRKALIHPSFFFLHPCRKGGIDMNGQLRRAHTLMELILVMAIFLIMAAMGGPVIVDSLSAGIKVDAATDAVRGAWAEAQAHAINEGRPYRFSVVSGRGNYRVAPDDGDYWEGVSPSAATDGSDPPLLLEKTLPPGIVFSSPEAAPAQDSSESAETEAAVDPSAWLCIAVFLPDGTARDDAELALNMGNSRAAVVKLRALTGAVTVQRGG
jgi:Tfp pilus assembly protein FimT